VEDKLDVILNKLNTLEVEIKGELKNLKDGQNLLLKLHFEAKDEIKELREEMNNKFDRVYINTDGIAKHFTDTTQEVAVIQYRQGEHSSQLEDHEERIKKLETIE
jgi:hypothetical protein